MGQLVCLPKWRSLTCPLVLIQLVLCMFRFLAWQEGKSHKYPYFWPVSTPSAGRLFAGHIFGQSQRTGPIARKKNVQSLAQVTGRDFFPAFGGENRLNLANRPKEGLCELFDGAKFSALLQCCSTRYQSCVTDLINKCAITDLKRLSRSAPVPLVGSQRF